MFTRKKQFVMITAGALVTAMLLADPPTSQPSGDGEDQVSQNDRTALRALIDRLGKDRADVRDQRHLLTHAEAIVPGAPRWQKTIRDQEAARLQVLRDRAQERAYDGAPPVMPHSRNFVQSKSCLDCHQEGIWLGERFGPPLSHPQMLNCMQCHVESNNLELPIESDILESTFSGTVAPRGGTVAWDGAPPVIPHTLLMRSRCLSCHGPSSYPGLRTTHPERLNCVQCHAVATELDQSSPFFTGQPLLTDLQPDAPVEEDSSKDN